MRSDKDYTPKTIIASEDYDNYLLMLHRELVKLSVNLDPPSPFRSHLTEGDDVRIVINDTNDLHYCIEYFYDMIENGDIKYAIVGDPGTNGYKFAVLDSICADFDIPVNYIKTKDWIIVMINISDNEHMVIEQSELTIRKR